MFFELFGGNMIKCVNGLIRWHFILWHLWLWHLSVVLERKPSWDQPFSVHLQHNLIQSWTWSWSCGVVCATSLLWKDKFTGNVLIAEETHWELKCMNSPNSLFFFYLFVFIVGKQMCQFHDAQKSHYVWLTWLSTYERSCACGFTPIRNQTFIYI